jgi:hypothetical protein
MGRPAQTSNNLRKCLIFKDNLLLKNAAIKAAARIGAGLRRLKAGFPQSYPHKKWTAGKQKRIRVA